MSKAHIYARNLGANWIGYGANLAVAFFMSPFVVHSLGDARYGVWTLLTSLTGYLGLVDIGVRGGTGQFINYHLGRGEDDEVSNVVSTSLFFYTLLSVAVLSVAGVLAFFFGSIFPKIPPEYVHEAQWVLLLLGLNVWVSFVSSTFSQLLIATERFDMLMIADVSVLVLKTLTTIWVLIAGGGLVQLGLVQVGAGLLGCLQVVALARWMGPRVHYHGRHIRWHSFREVFGYGMWSFLGNGAAQLGLYASSAIIGMLIGAAEITLYSIGAMLIGYSTNFLSRILNVLMPDILKAGGREDRAHLRWLIGKATRVTMFVAVPILVGFMTLGREFIAVWMGSGYTASFWVLLILTTAQFGRVANGSLAMAIISLGQVRLWAIMNAVQSLAALVLSVGLVLCTHLGIYGIALGTAIPLILTHNIWLFIVGNRMAGAKLRTALRSTDERWAMGAILFAVPCLVVSHAIPHGGWLLFWLKVGVVSIVYIPIGLFAILEKNDRMTIFRQVGIGRSWIRRKLAGDAEEVQEEVDALL